MSHLSPSVLRALAELNPRDYSVRVEFGQVRVDLTEATLAEDLAAEFGLTKRPGAHKYHHVWHGRVGGGIGVPVTVVASGVLPEQLSSEGLHRLLSDLGVIA